jgi:hypothetical protein
MVPPPVSEWPEELDVVEVKPFPQCHRLADGTFWHHEGDGKWEPYDGPVYVLKGTQEQKDKFVRLCEGRDKH